MTKKLQQIRRTFVDVLSFQSDVKKLIKRKIKENTYLNGTEIGHLTYMYPWVLLSHGSHKFFYKLKDGSQIPFSHITEYIEHLIILSEKKAPYVVLHDATSNRRVSIQWRDAWSALLQEIIYLEPYVREEAIHMSAEAPLREEPSAFEFSMKKKID